ncbi:MAG: hypothetical protein AB1486_24550 [Planctomycetota bacterium]
MLPLRRERTGSHRLTDRVSQLEQCIDALRAEKDRLQEEVSYLSEDADFGVLTRKAFLQICRFMPRGVRVFAFLDFDRVRELNDCLGYREVNRRIRACLSLRRRRSDLLARWFSGDELVILFDTTVRGARLRMRQYLLAAASQGLSFTYEFGTWVVGAETIESAVERAAERVLARKKRRALGSGE